MIHLLVECIFKVQTPSDITLNIGLQRGVARLTLSLGTILDITFSIELRASPIVYCAAGIDDSSIGSRVGYALLGSNEGVFSPCRS